ncbi:DNA internalization-related competence protein ComEC/Rec2 [Comamonas flocculans]|uniref:DNA internalization-related competence protein ComEC/Rec2 n=1 Tax=Comamonas flocculans TaxID=2597701 RepID=A0A5B8RTK7_9BURK|nr:DNA internalization-related competence protein ComEC/Rec2 [Comamonas flocculans]QEA12042.1 DNA internalization-related competence protein ComEC/Rec2 [Comamonas flocculans]
MPDAHASPDRPATAGPAARRSWHLPALLGGGLLGTALQLQQPALWPMAWYAGLWTLALAGWLWSLRAGRMGPRWTALAWLVGALLAFGVCGARSVAFSAQALADELEGVDLRLTGVVAAMPQRTDSGDVRFRLALESGEREGQPVALPALIELTWYASNHGRDARPVPALHAGERWRLFARLKAPHGTLNPHGFDVELWMWQQGVQASGYVRTSERLDARLGAPERLAATWQFPVEQLRQRVRDRITGYLTQGVQDPARLRAAGVVAALVTGDQRAIERSDWDLFRVTGVAHLMSISGLHITMFAWLAGLLVGMLWRRSAWLCLRYPAPSAALLGGVGLAGAYALFSGWGVPAERTLLMLASVALLRLSGREWPWPQVWLLACAVVLAFDPWAMLQPGFWLSFVAVGVLFATDMRAVDACRTSARARFSLMLREQAVVTVALAPLTLALFGQVSVVALVANLLAIPWVTVVVTPLAMLGVVLAPAWQLAAWCVQLLSLWLTWLAGWPLAQLTLAQAPLWAGAAAVLGAIVLVLRLPWPLRLLGLPLMLPAFWWQPLRPAPGQFEVLAVDVGQGQAVLVRTAGHSLLYDAGPRYGALSDAGQRVLVPLLQALGERPDRVLLSHSDSDHVGGAAPVLAHLPRAQVLGSIPADHPLQALRAIAPCAAGQQWRRDGVRFVMLHPPAGDETPARGKSSTNARSCVLRIEAQGGASAVLAGDIERAQELALVHAAAPLAADLLLVPHHGSKTSSSAAFLDAVQPALALVQAGYRNRFGHPAAQVVQRYRERGITLVASPRCGAARWSSADGELHCERERARRYWHHRLPDDAPEEEGE